MRSITSATPRAFDTVPAMLTRHKDETADRLTAVQRNHVLGNVGEGGASSSRTSSGYPLWRPASWSAIGKQAGLSLCRAMMSPSATLGLSRGCVCPANRASAAAIRPQSPVQKQQAKRLPFSGGRLTSHARPTLPCRSPPQASAAEDAGSSAKQSADKAASRAESALPNKTPEFKWGADMKKLAISVGIGALLWFLPHPSGVTTQAWHLLAIFVGTIVGIVTQPLPLGAVAMIGLGAAQLTKVLTFPQAFSAFASEIP